MYRIFHFWSICLMMLGSTAFPGEYYVSPGGDNGNAGNCEFPFRTVGKAFKQAEPGDIIYLADGIYEQTKITTERGGDVNNRITVKAINPRSVTITYDPVTNFTTSIMDIKHSHITIEGIVFDGQFVMNRPIRVQNGASGLILTNIEVKNARNNCIDMSAGEIRNDILIEKSQIHHCIRGDESTQQDAHGITGSTVRNLIIRDTEIYHVTGDAVQFDPQRRSTHWDVTIENCHFWTGPLPEQVPGFPAGFVIGENAFDSKHNEKIPTRSTLVIRNSMFNGWKNNPLISVEAALNIKEMVTAEIDGNVFFDNENGLRLRGRENDGGAHVIVINNVFYNNNLGIRYEDLIMNLRVYNNTFGPVNDRHLRPAPSDSGADLETFEVLNNLFLDQTKPLQAGDSSNLAVEAPVFVDVAKHNYRLVAESAPINSRVLLSTVMTDKDDIPRPQDSAYDVGAFEFRPNAGPTVENPVIDQMAIAHRNFTLCFPKDIFNDAEDGSHLAVHVTMADDSPLPSWLSFNSVRRELSGIPVDTDIGVISLKITGTDNEGAMVSDDFDITVIEAVTFEVAVHKGWNLISVPLAISTDIDDMFGSMMEGSVWEWSGQQHLTAVPRDAVLQPKIGYWIYCSSSDTIQITGVPVTDRRIYLGNHWNLVGPVKAPPFIQTSVEFTDALGQEDFFRDSIWRWDQTHFKQANQLEIGKGFLIYADQPSDNLATYEIRFDANFSSETHPFNFPPDAHFSPLAGAVHNANVSFWRTSQQASPGLTHLVEFGCPTLLTNEIEDELENDNVFSVISITPEIPATGSGRTAVKIQRNYPHVTVAARLAPSPDWFIGVDSLNLLENNEWVDGITIELFAYDAGTDGGVHYLSDDKEDVLSDPISLITRSPFFVGCDIAPLGTLTFTKR